VTVAELEARIRADPWRAVGAAVVVGVWLGLDPPRVPRNRLVRGAFAMLGSVVVRLAREAALRELAGRVA
jgi:hypothetical protein